MARPHIYRKVINVNTQELINTITKARDGNANFSHAALGVCIVSHATMIIDALLQVDKEGVSTATDDLNERYQFYVPGDDGFFHIADDNGGTLCGAKFGDGRPDYICDGCEEIKARITA